MVRALGPNAPSALVPLFLFHLTERASIMVILGRSEGIYPDTATEDSHSQIVVHLVLGLDSSSISPILNLLCFRLLNFPRETTRSNDIISEDGCDDARDTFRVLLKGG